MSKWAWVSERNRQSDRQSHRQSSRRSERQTVVNNIPPRAEVTDKQTVKSLIEGRQKETGQQKDGFKDRKRQRGRSNDRQRGRQNDKQRDN